MIFHIVVMANFAICKNEKVSNYQILHTTYSRNIKGQKCEDNCGLWVLNEIIKKIYPENLKKKMWVPFGSYLTNSTANPAQFEWKLAGLAVLFSR